MPVHLRVDVETSLGPVRVRRRFNVFPDCPAIGFNWRNADKYQADDPLAPARVQFDYAFAVAIMAQPLAWFEAQNLPETAFTLGAPVILAYRRHQQRIHAGDIFPIGEESSCAGWTGFQSLRGPKQGYILVFRELNRRRSAAVPLWELVGRALRCELVAGHGRSFARCVSADGSVHFSLPRPFSYTLYRYSAR